MIISSVQKIHFHYISTNFTFTNRNVLKQFILQLISKEGKQVETINYIFCSDNYLLKINKEYLKHNTYTDIITFKLSERNHPLLSDIYISVDRVKENACSFQTPFSKELRRVIFHGALHLCGYKDKTVLQIKLMRQKEEEYLKLYRFT